MCGHRHFNLILVGIIVKSNPGRDQLEMENDCFALGGLVSILMLDSGASTSSQFRVITVIMLFL